jgi:hypothetical protein
VLRYAGLDTTEDNYDHWLLNRCRDMANEFFDEAVYGDDPGPREAWLDMCDCCLAPLDLL